MDDPPSNDSQRGQTQTRKSPFDDLGATGLLTRSDREFLLGEKSYEDANAERKARNRLRTRIRNGIRDFELLAHHLEQQDRIQIVGDINAQLSDEAYRDDVITGMIHTVAFLYAAADDIDIPFETILEQGIEKSKFVYGNPFIIRNVDVNIDEAPDIDIDSIIKKIQEDEELTRLETRGIKSMLFSDLERFVEKTENIDIPREEYFEAGETLSRGRSLVLFGRSLAEETTLQPGRDDEVLHDEIRSQLLPP